MKPLALIVRTAGTNCDRELAHAFATAGAEVNVVHLNRLIDQPRTVESADLIGFPGGFSYGDDIAAGRIFANRLRHRLLAPLQAAVDRGAAIIGICNGFQVLVKLGLLPDPHAAMQTVTLADNVSGRFIARWVPLRVVSESPCIWTKEVGALELPIAHGEGRFVPADEQVLEQLRQQRQIAIVYDGENPNGSTADIAGICDPTGRVLGLMPHPERYCHATHHPTWSRRAGEALAETPAGLKFFLNAVEYAKANAASGQPVG